MHLAFLNVYGKLTVLSIVTDLGIRDYVSLLSQCHIYTSKCVLSVPRECALAEKDCLFNYVKLSFFCFLCPDRVGLPRALRGVSFSTSAGEKVTNNQKAISS